ncbi:MAG: peptidase A2, partial [Pseudomonadota bacterium]|nr:peptidase A2 [Pseudomonadota bacterium]
MARWIAVLLMALLGLSLAVNVYLWTALNSASNSDVFGDGLLLSNKARSNSASSASVSSPVGNAEAQHASSSELSNNRRSANTVETTESGGNTPSLEALLEKRQFDRLALELSNALKQTPFDERLLLLEADMIRLTKPLSIALIHLYDLAELPLSVDALEEIGKKIATLYQQAQEQLSRDQQWELLAKLNEPLFQRVPDSRQYALNLARAYAHQRKQTLMEDALAPLPFDDAQAQAIRAIAYKETAANDDTFGDTEFNDMQGDTTDTR